MAMSVISARLDELTNDRLLKRNVLLNLLSWTMPAAAALVSVPLLAKGLGPDRFGLVAITWASVGIFSLFDLGLGRALTRLVAERLSRGEEHEIGDLVWAASWLLLLLTATLATLGFVFAEPIVRHFMHVPIELQHEAVGVVRLLALSIPALAHGVLLRGVLEAGQRFGRVNQLRVPLGISSYAGPLLAIPFGSDARIAVGVIVAARIAYWLAHFPFLTDVSSDIAHPRIPRAAAVRELLHVGGWITVSNIVLAFLILADRPVVAALFPIAASGWYGAASELATKQWLFTAALLPVVFSAFAATVHAAPQRAAALAERATRNILLALLPSALLFTAFAEPVLRIWLGAAYVPDAAAALRWLTVGVYVNAVAQVAFAILQGGVDARTPALLHLAQLPVFALLLAFFVWSMGVTGVAVAWMLRMTIDAAALWWVTYRRMPDARVIVNDLRGLAAACFAAVALAAAWGALRF